MAEPQRFVAWRRPQGSDDAWAPLPQTEADSRVACYNLAMDDDLKSSSGCEYRVEPLGVVPARDDGKRLPTTYHHRMMRARRS